MMDRGKGKRGEMDKERRVKEKVIHIEDEEGKKKIEEGGQMRRERGR